MQAAPSQAQKSSPSGTRHITNPAISALVTSLMNSAQQFQQQAAGESAFRSSHTYPACQHVSSLAHVQWPIGTACHQHM
jgi:hypothetical protein